MCVLIYLIYSLVHVYKGIQNLFVMSGQTIIRNIKLEMGGGKYSFYLVTEFIWTNIMYNGVTPGGSFSHGNRYSKVLLVAFEYHEFKNASEVKALGQELAKEYYCRYSG